jgi:hypothetical protein
MELLALAAWIVTGAGGLVMAATWIAKGGLRRQDPVIAEVYRSMAVAEADHPIEGKEHIQLHVLLTHGAFALAGLALWVGVIIEDERDDAGLPWVAAILLVFVAGLGATMFLRWRRDRKRKVVVVPDQAIPAAVVYLHGLAALVTIALVVAAAAGVGD